MSEPSQQPPPQQPSGQPGYWPPEGYRTPPPPGGHAQQPGLGWRYEQPGYRGQPPPAYRAVAPQKKRPRIFLWVFLAVQAIFLIWLITGLAGNSNPSAAHDVAQQCANGAWHSLYNSYAQCSRQVTDLSNAANGIGTTIGAGLIIGLWVAADVILGVSYGIYRLATRR